MQKSIYTSDTLRDDAERQHLTNVRLPFSTENKTIKKTPTQTDASKKVHKEETSREITNEVRLNKLVIASQQSLMNISSVFPFDFFPDQISVETNQINVVKKTFFATYHIQSIPIKNVADVFLQTSYFFASLKIIDSSYIENSIEVEYLRKSEACRARNVIQGLVIAMKEGIDLSRFSAEELAKKAEILGSAQGIDLSSLERIAE